ARRRPAAVSEFHFRNRLKDYLDGRHVEDADCISDFLGGCLQSDIAIDPQAYQPGPFGEWLDLCGQDLDNLSTGRFGRRRNQLLSQGLLDVIFGARRPLVDGFTPASPRNRSGDAPPDFLFRCGFVGRLTTDGRLRFGYSVPRKPSLPTTLFEALHNVPPLAFLPEPYAGNYERCISGRSPEWPPHDKLSAVDLTSFNEALRDYYLEVISEAKSRCNPWFVNLDNAVDFYLRIQSLY